MTWPHFIMYAVVICIGLPAALRNPTAGMLVLNWAVGEFAWMVTADNLPLKVYFMVDISVLAMICAKATWAEGCRTYPTLDEQTRCLWMAMTVWDRWIAGIFLCAVWPIYVLNLDASVKWYALWGLLIAQFFLAAGEAVQSLLGDTRKARQKPPPGGSGLAYAGPGNAV